MTSRFILAMLLLGVPMAHAQVIGGGGAQSDVAAKATRRPAPVRPSKRADAPPPPEIKGARRTEDPGAAPLGNRPQPAKPRTPTVARGR